MKEKRRRLPFFMKICRISYRKGELFFLKKILIKICILAELMYFDDQNSAFMENTEYFYRVTMSISCEELSSNEIQEPVEDVEEFRHPDMLIAKGRAEDFWSRQCENFDEEKMNIKLALIKKAGKGEKEYMLLSKNTGAREAVH